MKNDRNHYTAEEKVATLRRHLLDKVPVSTLCEELNLQARGLGKSSHSPLSSVLLNIA
jgi:hypothetical protein